MRRLAITLCVLLAVAATATAEDSPKLYKHGDGPHAIATVHTLVLHDAEREKDLEMRVTYPKKTEGPLPLVIFSHGAAGRKDGYQPLATYWASHGYIVIRPTHADSWKYGGRIEDRRSISKHWRSRPQDITFIIDSLDDIEKKVKPLAGRIDREKIAVGGHSYGAFTTQFVGGTTGYIGRREVVIKDERPKCLIVISPQGTGGMFKPESYKTLDRPALMITGDHDGTPYGDGAGAWRREAFDHAAPGDKHLLWTHGAHHNFGGIAVRRRYPKSGPIDDNQVDIVRCTALAFLDAQLKADQQAKAFLTDAEVRKATGDKAKLESK